MLLYISLILASLAIIIILVNIQSGILVAILLKPIIDTSWNHYIFGVNSLQLIGVFIPSIILIYSAISGKTVLKTPFAMLWLIFLCYNIFSSSLILLNNFNIKAPSEVMFRILNGFVGYYMIQTYFYKKSDFKKLLLVFLFAGLFPMLMGIYQASTGVVWRERHTTGGLVRNVGLYHDAFSFRAFVFQTLTAILLYWEYFLEKGKAAAKKFILICYSFICAVVLFKVYSKAGYVVLALWVLIWMFSKKQFAFFLVVLLVLISLNFFTGNTIWSQLETVFSKEVVAMQDGSEDSQKRTLAGRWFLWEQIWNNWSRQPLFAKFFGSGTSAGGSHNDYLRALVSGGVFGLLIYISLLVVMGVKVLKNYLRERTGLHIMALMIYLMWMVDTIGLVPSLYPAYQWYVWGIIGLSFVGLEDDSQKPAEAVGSSIKTTC